MPAPAAQEATCRVSAPTPSCLQHPVPAHKRAPQSRQMAGSSGKALVTAQTCPASCLYKSVKRMGSGCNGRGRNNNRLDGHSMLLDPPCVHPASVAAQPITSRISAGVRRISSIDGAPISSKTAEHRHRLALHSPPSVCRAGFAGGSGTPMSAHSARARAR